VVTKKKKRVHLCDVGTRGGGCRRERGGGGTCRGKDHSEKKSGTWVRRKGAKVGSRNLVGNKKSVGWSGPTGGESGEAAKEHKRGVGGNEKVPRKKNNDGVRAKPTHQKPKKQTQARVYNDNI